MRINMYVIGKTKNSSISDLVSYYSRLLGKYSKFNLKTINLNEEGKIKSESLEKYFGQFNVLLSEDGKTFTTRDFANYIEKKKLSFSEINFFIANAYGFEEELKKKADLLLSLSPMTFTHEMALALLLEQLYRCMNLAAGGKYHK